MKNKKLSWDEISKHYDQEWVELVDFDWPEEEPYPLCGVVRTHGKNKNDFHLECRRDPVPMDSAFIYVGKKKSFEHAVFSPSLIRVTPCEK